MLYRNGKGKLAKFIAFRGMHEVFSFVLLTFIVSLQDVWKGDKRGAY